MAKQRTLTPAQMARLQARFRNNYQESAGLLMQFNIAISGLNDPDLTNSQKRVLGAILTLSNNETGEAFVNRDSIAALTGLSLKTVSNAVSGLGKSQYVAYARTSYGKGQGTASAYQLNGMSEAEVEEYTAALERAQAEMLGISNQEKPAVTRPQNRDITKIECDEQAVTGPQNGELYIVSSPDQGPVTGLFPEIGTCKSQLPQSREVQPPSLISSNSTRRKKGRKKESQSIYTKEDAENFKEFWEAYPHYGSRSTKHLTEKYFIELINGNLQCHIKGNPNENWPASPVTSAALVECARYAAKEVRQKPDLESQVPGSDRYLVWGRYERTLLAVKKEHEELRKRQEATAAATSDNWDSNE